jgi:hypothetical protein
MATRGEHGEVVFGLVYIVAEVQRMVEGAIVRPVSRQFGSDFGLDACPVGRGCKYRARRERHGVPQEQRLVIGPREQATAVEGERFTDTVRMPLEDGERRSRNRVPKAQRGVES